MFSPGRRFAKEHMLESNCFKNFARLGQGLRGIPVCVMMNPCDRHTGDFGDMFTKNAALLWLKSFFGGVGLSLEHDVPILDIFSLLSTDWLRQGHGGQSAEHLIFRSCEITQDILEALNPPSIVVMQCVTNPHQGQRNSIFGRVQHPLAQALFSSMGRAREGKVHTCVLGRREIPVVAAFHPSKIHYEQNLEKKRHHYQLLQEILLKTFSPYVQDLHECSD
ncbi:uncharacterized protein LDX57_012093 [Aspergillus melleus]|uniref:uncharacterized protein n=1 Tax=Aspergillus melleus TaxID=138277 RepID=UPI001E8EA3CF|nr:uncharacterized protein LDX57_012093 [Aspergillus melleus]KAH8434446.1 hypothetical protein LDX57_012093 [Aspergillus melleus]